MNIQEHDNNIITKERTSIEKYLLRIIQRYFDIENNYTKESIEEMIIESMTRFKQFIADEKGFIFSLNRQTGNITLSMRDFDGQQSFSKRTAFNKDFGTIEDTICEGNDLRLYDDRIPLYHNQPMSDINGLDDVLYDIENCQGTHYHDNQDVIDILKYTGNRISIDLMLLDTLIQRVEKYKDTLNKCDIQVIRIEKDNAEIISNLLIQVQQNLLVVQDIINNNTEWIEDAKKYTDNKVSSARYYFEQESLKSLTQAEVDTLQNHMEQSYYVIADGEIPLTDGTITCTPMAGSEIIEASSEEGSTLKEIFDSGIQIGNLKDRIWIWNNTNNSFQYTENDQDYYSALMSLSVYNDYTHRVTLGGGNDNDVISVVIAYDEESGQHLSLLISNGGPSFNDTYGKAMATVALDYSGDHGFRLEPFFCTGKGPNDSVSDNVLYQILNGTGDDWNRLVYGVTVLIKKEDNNIKIWVKYNDSSAVTDFAQEEIDGIMGIYPTEDPLIEFDFSEYNELSNFVDTKCHYGYGCYSQDDSTYTNVYFIGESFSASNTSGTAYTNTREYNEITKTIPPEVLSSVAHSKIKLFMRYEDDDGIDITLPLPYMFIDDNNNEIVIQGSYTETGIINIETNFITKIPELYTDMIGVYQNSYILGCIHCESLSTISSLANSGITTIRIEDKFKNNFIADLIPDDDTNLYKIQGESVYSYTRIEAEDRYLFSDNTELEYFNWTTQNKELLYIGINSSGGWVSVNTSFTGYYTIEYKIKKLLDYFNNPRVYYQVLGSEA